MLDTAIGVALSWDAVVGRVVLLRKGLDVVEGISGGVRVLQRIKVMGVAAPRMRKHMLLVLISICLPRDDAIELSAPGTCKSNRLNHSPSQEPRSSL